MTDQTDGRKSCENDDSNCKKCDKTGCNGSGAATVKLSILLGITFTFVALVGLLR